MFYLFPYGSRVCCPWPKGEIIWEGGFMPYVRRRSIRPMGLILVIVGAAIVYWGLLTIGTEV